MIDGIVFQVCKAWDNQTAVQLVRAPYAVADFGSVPLQCDQALPPLGSPNAVQQHGQALFNALARSHAQVNEILQRALGLQNGAWPIYLQFKSLPQEEAQCWEALCDPAGNFMALDRRWPLARVAGTFAPERREIRAFDGSLRILAVLSAANRDARGQWQALYGAIEQARKDGLAIQLQVATGQEDLQDHIHTLLDQDLHLQVVPLRDLVELVQQIDDFAPHLTHFFCHGSVSYGKPRLMLATLNGEEIELTLPDLLGSPGLRDNWLVVLNCCDSGAGSQDTLALNHQLVAGGVSAAIGMKEEVSEADAALFSARLYPGLLKSLGEKLTGLAPGADTMVEWAAAMWAPRRTLRDHHQANPGAYNWTLPVLYVQPEPFRVKRAPPLKPAERSHQSTIAELLALLSPEQQLLLQAELAEIRAGG